MLFKVEKLRDEFGHYVLIPKCESCLREQRTTPNLIAHIVWLGCQASGCRTAHALLDMRGEEVQRTTGSRDSVARLQVTLIALVLGRCHRYADRCRIGRWCAIVVNVRLRFARHRRDRRLIEHRN
jgi:hypothetical protein